MAMIDIDHFKKVNDTYGHDVGDMVIKLATKTISSLIEQNNAIFARIGGEEFVLIFEGINKDLILELLKVLGYQFKI